MRRLLNMNLLARFAIASLVPIVVLAIVLSQYLRHRFEENTLNEARRAAVLIARVGFQPQLTEQDLKRGLAPERIRALDSALASKGMADGVSRVKIWNRSVRVVYSDRRSLIGRRFHIFGHLREALNGRVSSEVANLTRADNVGERRFGKLLEVYVPLVLHPGDPPAGAIDVYLPYEPLAQQIARDTKTAYLLILAGVILLYATLFRIVAGASRRLRAQAAELTRRADELRHQAAEKEHQALHDPLTDLPNRVLFRDRIRHATLAARRAGTETAVLLMDLDRFKEINDTLGHHCGDLLLQELGARLNTAIRSTDTVARLGGDEFGVVLPDLSTRDAITEVVGRIRTAVEEPVLIEGLPLTVEASIGVALFPEHGEDVDTLLQRADVAMYLAKERSSACEIYDDREDGYDPTRLALISELRRAIDERELVVYYQPKADLRTGEVESVEALVRWEHPERGLIPPDEFIPLAQHTGLMTPLTLYVLEEAVRQVQVWRANDIRLRAAVNLGTRNLLDPRLPETVAEILRRWDVEADALELEITETTIMSDPARATAVLKRLKDLGVTLSIDDFGTGYSSLSYLKRLPVDAVKIDKSFVLSMTSDENDAAIVRSTIELARGLGLSVVAEGVENEAIWRDLATLGCDVAQGYYLSRPVPAPDLTTWLDSARGAGTPAGRPVNVIPLRERLALP